MKNKETGIVATISSHARERIEERAPIGFDTVAEFEGAVPFGAQRGTDVALLSPSNIVFCVKRFPDANVVITALTREQAIANMQTALSYTSRIGRTADSWASEIEASRAKTKQVHEVTMSRKAEIELEGAQAAIAAFEKGERLATKHLADTKICELKKAGKNRHYRDAYIYVHRQMIKAETKGQSNED